MSDRFPVPEPGDAVALWGKRGGPVHLANPSSTSLSWCGSRQRFQHRDWTGTLADVTCKTCLRRVRVGRPLAYRARS